MEKLGQNNTACDQSFTIQPLWQPALTLAYVSSSIKEMIVDFFDFESAQACVSVNKDWAHRILYVKRKKTEVNVAISMLVYTRLRDLLGHTEKKPMTSHQLRMLVMAQKSFEPFFPCTHLISSNIRHFWLTDEDHAQNVWMRDTIFQIEAEPAIAEQLDILSSNILSWVKHKGFINQQVEDKGLSLIRHFTILQSLTIGGAYSNITDHEFRHIAHVTTLESLSVRAHKITDESLTALGSLVRLRKLTLRSPLITDWGLYALSSLKGLQKLTLECGLITDLGLNALSGLIGLQSLGLEDNQDSVEKITMTGIAQLAHLPVLRSLNLVNRSFTEMDITHLNRFTLRHLNLTRCHGISSVSLSSLASPGRLAGLQGLNLCSTKIEDQDLVALANFTALQDLNICSCDKITLSGIKHLESLIKPRKLHVYHYGGFLEDDQYVSYIPHRTLNEINVNEINEKDK